MTKPLTDGQIARRLANLGPPTEVPIVEWTARRHVHKGSPDSVRVAYGAGVMAYPEWVLIEHEGLGRYRAEKWWVAHGGQMPVTATVTEMLDRWGEVQMPATIVTRKNGKWFDIIGRIHAAQQVAA